MVETATTIVCPMALASICYGKCLKIIGDRKYFSDEEYPKCMTNCVNFTCFKIAVEQCGTSCIELALNKLKPQKEDLKTFERIKEIKDNINRFVFEGNNLFITSPYVRNGRTTILLKFLYGYFWSVSDALRLDGLLGKYINVPEFIVDINTYKIRHSENFQNKIELLKTIPLVVWDDITTCSLDEASMVIIPSIISARLRNGKANIIAGLEVNNLDAVLGKVLSQQIQSFEQLKITKKYKKFQENSFTDCEV